MTQKQEDFTLQVNPTSSRQSLIGDGRYDYVEDYIIHGNFVNVGGASQGLSGGAPYREGGIKVSLVPFTGLEQGFDLAPDFIKRGMILAPLDLLLAFGAQFPDVNRGTSIFALGSFVPEVRGGRHYPYIDEFSGKRKLRISYREYYTGWDHPRCWALVISLAR